jgi:hypothetical protein
MARAKFSYIPNMPGPGEAELALGTANNPVAGIHLLNAQMERRHALDQHNATMEQIMEAQNAQAAEASRIDLIKAMASASNPMFQAQAARMGGAPEDEITRLQQMEAQAALAENMQRAGAGMNSFSEAGAQGTDPLTAFGLPDNMKMGMRPDVLREGMGNETQLRVANIGADATRYAARERGAEGGSRPSVTISPIVPGIGGVQFKAGNSADALTEYGNFMGALGQPTGEGGQIPMPIEADKVKLYDDDLNEQALAEGKTRQPGSIAQRIIRPDGTRIIIAPATNNQTGQPDWIQMIEPPGVR